MIKLDGSLGEGGGQILRTALGLSALTGQAFSIVNIRAGREKPGLLRQHLTAVQAAAAICGAKVDGAAINASALSFTPGAVQSGTYGFAVGTAGSTTLVLQAVLPALLTATGPTRLTIEGGTHNTHAPPLDFLLLTFLPIINLMGPRVEVEMESGRDFIPPAEGRIHVTITPAPSLAPIALMRRGEVIRVRANAMVAALPGEIARRELETIESLLGWTGEQLVIRQTPESWGPGNVLTLEVESEQVTEVFTGFGMRGVSAHRVAAGAAAEARAYLDAGAPVGTHLADQLLIPMAMAGKGEMLTMALTDHTTTNMKIISEFLPVHFKTSVIDGQTRVEVSR